MASTKLRLYFETHPVHIKSNYPIKCVLRKPEMSGRMAKWSVKLSAYNLIYEPRNAIKSQALADFTSDLQNEVDLEVQQLDEIKDKWVLYTDGASNINGTGLGIILKSPQGDIIPQAINCEFQATNNEAEYEALIAGLQLAKDIGVKHLQVYMDSLLVVNHYNGTYAVKGEKLVLYLDIVKKLADTFEIFSIEQIPREENTEADALANLGSTLRIPPDIKISIIHILAPAITNKEEEAKVCDVDDPDSRDNMYNTPPTNYSTNF